MVPGANKRWRNALIGLPLLTVVIVLPIVALPQQSHGILRGGTYLAGKCYIDSCTIEGTLWKTVWR